MGIYEDIQKPLAIGVNGKIIDIKKVWEYFATYVNSYCKYKGEFDGTIVTSST
jgi:hypothetical protein